MTRTQAEREASARYSDRIRGLIGARRMTQVELARDIGMTESALRRRMRPVEQENAVWSATELAAVARALGVPMETLTQDTGAKS